MKKTLLLFVVVLCTFSLFATKNSIGFKFAPAASQISTSSNEKPFKVSSTYGIGAEVTFKRTIDCVEGLFGQAGLSWNTYLLPGNRPALTSLMAFAEAGYDYQIRKEIRVSGHIGLGTDTLIYDKTGSENLTLKLGLDCGYKINEKIEVTAGCEATFGFPRNKTTKYANYRIIPSIGMTYEL